MNTERLLAVANALVAELSETQSQQRLSSIVTNLQNITANPGQPQFQQELSQALTDLRNTLPSARSNSFPPTWVQTMDEMQISGEFGVPLLDSIDSTLAANQLTPSVAVPVLEGLLTGITETSAHLKSLAESLHYFNFEPEEVAAGEAEMSVLIPRRAVHDHLEELGREFQRIDRIIGPFQELATGSRPSVQVKSIASSDFGIFVGLHPLTAAEIAAAIKFILDSYKQILEIGEMRRKAKESSILPDSIAEAIEEAARVGMEEAIDRFVVERFADEKRGGREHELRTDIKSAMNAIANRIDRGYSIDVSAGPDETDDDLSDNDAGKVQQALADIRHLAPDLLFQRTDGDPILELPEGRAVGPNGSNDDEPNGQDDA